jgi:AraC family transcriptional regulator
MLTAPEQISLVDGRPLPLAAPVFRDGTRLRFPWLRRGYHGYVPGFNGHLIGSYHGRAEDCCWVIENKRLRSPLSPGAITVLPEQHDGRWHLPGPVEVAHVYLADQRLQDCAAPLTKGRRVELIPRVGFADPVAAAILRLVFEQSDLDDAGSTLFVEQAIELLCIQLVRAHSSMLARSSPAPTGGLTRRQMALVASYMHEHMDEDVTLTELASLVDLSRFHFCRAFRLAAGVAPYAWLRAHRMRQAHMLITSSTLPIAEIALSVGYRTPSAFAASFRKAFGKSPSYFRQELL